MSRFSKITTIDFVQKQLYDKGENQSILEIPAPEGFSGKVRTAAAAKGGSLMLSPEPAEIDGGFLLIYGGVEENCGIKAIFDSVKDELSDQVKRMLFG